LAHRKSTLDDLVTIASRLPWWLNLLLALGSWLYLHSIAIARPAALSIANPKQISAHLPEQLLHAFALFGQYLLPGIFIFSAVISVIDRTRNKKILHDVANASQPGQTLDGISWQRFEKLVGEVFRRKGFKVTETPYGPDGGVDLILHKNNEKYLVQCKHWRAQKVGLPVVREFLGAMVAEGAVGGFVVTAGLFTNEARSFAKGRNIHLVEGAELRNWIAALRQPATPPQVADSPRQSVISPIREAAPVCPACGSEMQMRTARRGTNAGRDFWGCVRYPNCRGTVPL